MRVLIHSGTRETHSLISHSTWQTLSGCWHFCQLCPNPNPEKMRRNANTAKTASCWNHFLGFFTIVWADDDACLHCGIHEPDKVPKQVLPWAIFEVSGLCFWRIGLYCGMAFSNQTACETAAIGTRSGWLAGKTGFSNAYLQQANLNCHKLSNPASFVFPSFACIFDRLLAQQQHHRDGTAKVTSVVMMDDLTPVNPLSPCHKLTTPSTSAPVSALPNPVRGRPAHHLESPLGAWLQMTPATNHPIPRYRWGLERAKPKQN